MKPSRIGELLAAFLGFASAGVSVMEQRALGFPDGHLSQLDRTMRLPHYALAGVCVMIAVALAGGGLRWRWWLVAVLAAAVLLDHWGLRWIGVQLGLEYGQGG